MTLAHCRGHFYAIEYDFPFVVRYASTVGTGVPHDEQTRPFEESTHQQDTLICPGRGELNAGVMQTLFQGLEGALVQHTG